MESEVHVIRASTDSRPVGCRDKSEDRESYSEEKSLAATRVVAFISTVIKPCDSRNTTTSLDIKYAISL